MSVDDLDLIEVLAEVVQPCIAQLVRHGELERVSLDYRHERSLFMPDRPQPPPGLTTSLQEQMRWREEVRLVLSMTLKGEDFVFHFRPHPSIDPYPQTEVENQRAALYDELQDFIAQSNFAWGQQRG